MTDRNSLTSEQLRKLLHYDPELGWFMWLQKRGNQEAGSIAGCLDPDGYCVIGLNYRTERAARLAWLYVTDSWPANEVDHEDRNRSNDAWLNLREATHSENASNAGNRLPNTSGYRGVVFVKRTGRWLAKVVVAKKQHYFGTHKTPVLAAKAYDRGAKLLHGRFALLNFPAAS